MNPEGNDSCFVARLVRVYFPPCGERRGGQETREGKKKRRRLLEEHEILDFPSCF